MGLFDAVTRLLSRRRDTDDEELEWQRRLELVRKQADSAAACESVLGALDEEFTDEKSTVRATCTTLVPRRFAKASRQMDSVDHDPWRDEPTRPCVAATWLLDQCRES